MLIWLMFLLGQLMHLGAQIDSVVRATNNPATSRIEIFKDRWIPITVRSFICSMLFGVFLSGHGPDVLKAFNIPSPNWLIALSVLMTGTGIAGVFMAGLAGFGIDSAIGYIPYFKAYIPPPVDQQASVQTKGFAQGVDAAKHAVEEVKPPALDAAPAKD